MDSEREASGTEVVRREDRSPETPEATDRSALPTGMLQPVDDPGEIVRGREKRSRLISEALQEGRDYGSVRGIPKPFLQKPGAERLTDAFGCYPRFRVLDSEVDHDRRVEWEKVAKTDDGEREVYDSGTSKGLYRYVVSCDLVHRASGIVVGNGLGSCSTMESKYVDRPRDSENTVLKMAKKRAHVDAALSTFGLSEMFTQDEDYVRGERAKRSGPLDLTDPPTFGKYGPDGDEGPKTWAWIVEHRPDYIGWLKDNTDKLSEADLKVLREERRRVESHDPRPEAGGESGGESEAEPPESPSAQWIRLYEKHRETSHRKRRAWETRVLEEEYDEVPTLDDDLVDHNELTEEHYETLADRLMVEVDEAS